MSNFITKEGHPAIQGEDGGPWFVPTVNPFGHGCCQCSLFHAVEYALVDGDGEVVEMAPGVRLALRFTTDHEETKRLREFKKGGKTEIDKALDDAMVYGSGFVFVPSDGGEMRHVDPWDVVLDPPVSVEYPPYMPTCGTEMIQFCSNFCDNCADPDESLWNEKQEGSGCKFIIEATAEDKQPEPWVVKDGKAHCLNFRRSG